MYPERSDTYANIAQLNIPHGTIAALAGVSPSKVSEYVKQLYVSGRASVCIEHAVSDLVSLIDFMAKHLSLRPDLRDVGSLRAAIEGLKAAKRSVELQKDRS